MSYWILCLEGSGKEMKKGITGKSADSQSNEELDEMLVEESLHDGDDKNAKDPTEGNDKNGTARCQPDFVIIEIFLMVCTWFLVIGMFMVIEITVIIVIVIMITFIVIMAIGLSGLINSFLTLGSIIFLYQTLDWHQSDSWLPPPCGRGQHTCRPRPGHQETDMIVSEAFESLLFLLTQLEILKMSD